MALVWTATLDKRYLVEVHSDRDPYAGKLTVTDQENGEVLHESDVGIAYGAPFGADVDDVAQWQEIALQVVDGKGGEEARQNDSGT